MTYKTVERLEELLRACLSEIPKERRVADLLLEKHFNEEGDTSDELAPLVDEATARLGDEREPFLRALVQFWAGIIAVSNGAGATGKTNWRQWAKPSGYPFSESIDIEEWTEYGDGIGRYLLNRRASLRNLLPLFITCINHPAKQVRDVAATVVGAHAPAAKSAFAPLLNRVFRGSLNESGPAYFDAIAAIVDAHPEFVTDLVAAINTPFVGCRIEGVVLIANRLTQAPSRLYHAFFDRLRSKMEPADRQVLAFAAARWSQRHERERAEELVALAESLRTSAHPLERATAGGIIGLVSSKEEGERLTVEQLNDPEADAAYAVMLAAGQFSEPSPELVDAVAQYLGSSAENYALHDIAISVLVRWGAPAGTAAVPHIERWLRHDKDLPAGQLFTVLDHLGEAAYTLRDRVQVLVERLEAERDEGDDDWPADDDEEPPQEPGTEPRWIANPSPLHALRAWLAAACRGTATTS